MMQRLRTVAAAGLFSLLCAALPAKEAPGAKLIEPQKSLGGFAFDNGSEFPGAKGSLDLDKKVKHGSQVSLKLNYNFTDGGAYVQAATTVKDLSAGTLTFWIKAPGQTAQTIRLVGDNGVCHQIVLELPKSDDWQQVTFPIKKFFDNYGTPNAIPGVQRYEVWGGKDGDKSWSGKVRTLVFIAHKGEQAEGALWLSDMILLP